MHGHTELLECLPEIAEIASILVRIREKSPFVVSPKPNMNRHVRHHNILTSCASHMSLSAALSMELRYSARFDTFSLCKPPKLQRKNAIFMELFQELSLPRECRSHPRWLQAVWGPGGCAFSASVVLAAKPGREVLAGLRKPRRSSSQAQAPHLQARRIHQRRVPQTTSPSAKLCAWRLLPRHLGRGGNLRRLVIFRDRAYGTQAVGGGEQLEGSEDRSQSGLFAFSQGKSWSQSLVHRHSLSFAMNSPSSESSRRALGISPRKRLW